MNLQIIPYPLREIIVPRSSLKTHPEKQVQQIADSIQAFGFNDPLAIDGAGEIIEGVGRYLAARKLALESVPVIQLTHLTEARKKAYRIAHNKIAANSGFDLDALRQEFESLCQLDASLLSLTGFEPIELEDLLQLPDMPDLAPELTESLRDASIVTCPHCGGAVHV